MLKKILFNTSNQIFIGLSFGILTGYFGNPFVLDVARNFSNIYIQFLKLVSPLLIFFSICSTMSSIVGLGELKSLGSRVLFYALLTTIVAAAMGLGMYMLLDPKIDENLAPAIAPDLTVEKEYKIFLHKLFPSNFVGAFLDNNVIAIMIMAFLTGFSTLSLEVEKKESLRALFSSLFDLIIKITELILKFIPLAIWAFVTIFVTDQKSGLDLGPLGIYFSAVIGANLIQALIILPLLLYIKGYSPLLIVKGYSPALSIAFFSKSSNAALPTTIRCAQQNLRLSKKVTNFTLPLCTTCNMNGCASFIIITVLFVASSHGLSFSTLELVVWVLLASLAAIGNAGVPMGCYFLSTAFLVEMNIPLNIMGLILPIYAFMDMVETALNVWSDGVIAVLVDKDSRA